MSKPVQIKCPTCKRQGDWFAGAYGPFCSKRCKLIDLGKWLGEEHRVSGPLTAEALEDAPEGFLEGDAPAANPKPEPEE